MTIKKSEVNMSAYHQASGHYSGGSFMQALQTVVERADASNRAKLESVFPTEIAGFMAGANGWELVD